MKTFKVMVAILIGVSLFFVGGISVANAAEVEVGAGENTITADISEQPITIAPNITLSNFGSNLSSSKIVVENLPESLVLRNVLSTSYSGGLSVVYDDNTNVCTITGSDSAANYEALLRTFTFDTGATYANNIKFNFIVAFDDNDAMYYSENGHYYEYVEEVNPISWTDANEAITDSSNGGVSRKTYNGMKGYMVTITSEGENNFVVEKMIGNSWIGASDVGAEDDWKWTTGPEANTSFWSGDENGSAVNGEYNNWGSGEPNDYGDGEDYAHIFINDSDESKIDGEWNDFKVDDDRVYGYVVEYGGMTGDTPTDLSETITVNIINTIVTLDTVSEGGLEAAAGAIVSDPTNVRELHIYSGALNDVEDINYINSLVNLEVLNVRGNVVVANAGDDFCKQTSTAFNDLREVTFPATTIGNYAFQGCNSLESIYFPNATSVGYGVAGSCNFLLYASFPKMTEAGSGFLSSCWDLTHVYLPKATTFAHSAFMGNYDLENIILPEATSFDFNAFAASPGAALAYVYMPNVGNIGNNAFSKCDSLTELHLGSAEPTLGGTLGEDGASTRYVLVPDATEYGGVGADWNGWTVGLYTNATITYDANGADSGTPPTDSSYAYNTTATIQANTDLALAERRTSFF